MGKKRKNIKLIYELKSEIEKLEKNIKNIESLNTKIKLLKIYKILLKYLQLVAPYIIAITITFNIACKLGLTPFYVDKTKLNLETMKEFDTNGNIRYIEQYEKFNNSKNQIMHYSKWEQIEENLYQRSIKTYSLDNINEEKIYKLINDKNIKSIKDLLGEPVLIKKETRNNLSEKELISNECIKAIIFETDTNKAILVDEKVGDNVFLTIAWIVLTIWCLYGIKKFREDYSLFDLEDSIDIIKEKYPEVKKEDLIKKLEIKKATYNRLKR